MKSALDDVIGIDALADLEIPQPLQASLERHRQNLARLVENLRSMGTSEAQIEASVSVLVQVYKDELLTAMKALVN